MRGSSWIAIAVLATVSFGAASAPADGAIEASDPWTPNRVLASSIGSAIGSLFCARAKPRTTPRA